MSSQGTLSLFAAARPQAEPRPVRPQLHELPRMAVRRDDPPVRRADGRELRLRSIAAELLSRA